MSSQPKADLWDFAGEFYGDDAIKDRCLELQESHKLSVNLLLWLCWLHAHNIELEPIALVQGKNIVGGVNVDLLTALREARTEIVASCSFTRVQEQLIKKHILNAELAIEKIILQRLQDVTTRLPKAENAESRLTLLDYLQEAELEQAEAEATFFTDKLENLYSAHYEVEEA